MADDEGVKLFRVCFNAENRNRKNGACIWDVVDGKLVSPRQHAKSGRGGWFQPRHKTAAFRES